MAGVFERKLNGERTLSGGALGRKERVGAGQSGGESERGRSGGIREDEVRREPSDAASDIARRVGASGRNESVDRGQVREQTPAGKARGAPASSGERVSEDGGAQSGEARRGGDVRPVGGGGRESEVAGGGDDEFGRVSGEDEQSERFVIVREDATESGDRSARGGAGGRAAQRGSGSRRDEEEREDVIGDRGIGHGRSIGAGGCTRSERVPLRFRLQFCRVRLDAAREILAERGGRATHRTALPINRRLRRRIAHVSGGCIRWLGADFDSRFFA